MNTDKLASWSQVFASIGVIIGLALVTYELQQSKALGNVSTVGVGISNWADDHRTVLGEDAAKSLTKACLSPEDLTREDLTVLHYYYSNRLLLLYHLKTINIAGSFNLDETERFLTQVHLSYVASTKPGREWLRIHADVLYPNQRQVLAEVFEQSPLPDCGTRMNEFYRSVQGQSSDDA